MSSPIFAKSRQFLKNFYFVISSTSFANENQQRCCKLAWLQNITVPSCILQPIFSAAVKRADGLGFTAISINPYYTLKPCPYQNESYYMLANTAPPHSQP